MHREIDRLTEAGSPDHVVILNYGDPAYNIVRDNGVGLSRAESIFLRIVAYLVFADTVSIPTRHILEGGAMSQAVVWAAPLLEEGILVPERRAEVRSFEELVIVRNLPEISRERAAFLEAHASQIRVFRFHELAKQYRQFLATDLELSGAFRKTIKGAVKGELRDALSRAHDDPDIARIITPEDFVRVVARYAPSKEASARRWAMARYYTTPLLFDEANTREIPDSAASLLIKGGVLDPAIPPFKTAAPAEETYHRLVASIPVEGIATSSHEYCEAVLEVRRSLPEARKIFSDIREAAQLADAGKSLSARLASELAKQKRVRPGSGRVYTIASSLLGGALGIGLGGVFSGQDAAVAGGLGLSLISGLASNEIQKRLEGREDEKKRPWLLAMDRLEGSVGS